MGKGGGSFRIPIDLNIYKSIDFIIFVNIMYYLIWELPDLLFSSLLEAMRYWHCWMILLL